MQASVCGGRVSTIVPTHGIPSTFSRSGLLSTTPRAFITRATNRSPNFHSVRAKSSISSFQSRSITTRSQFAPAGPINPASLPKATPAKHYRPTRKWLRRLFRLALAGGAAYLADRYLNSSGLTRSLNTFRLGLVVGLDYKINFRAHPLWYDTVEDLHNKSAERLFNLLRHNGGLYLKIGQAIAMQSAILPPQFQKMFARMFDDAPQNSWADVEKVIREDFGKSPEEVFGVNFDGQQREGVGIMERTARASASVAQVHWARLPDGREVAIKIQKREIARQVGWDLWAFKVVAKAYTWMFDIPVYTLVPYISERLMLETDFENEADNSERMKALVEGESRLRGRVYIPKVYRELSSKRVMTAEWIEGVRLWDKEGVQSSWQGGWRTGTPGCSGTPLDPPSKEAIRSIATNNPLEEKLKPERDYWKGRNGKGGLGLSMKQVMTTMVDLFSAQMFLWGWVHCDPHPGNIFVRRLPSGKPELVLIDHGLYIHMDPKFREEYALFWKSLMTFDNKTIKNIVSGWGINSPDVFASVTLMRPYTGGDGETSRAIRGLSEKEEKERAFEMQQKMRQGIRQILGDEKKWPKELIFIGRNLRIVQGNNQFLGSPVNRIKITGMWASRALVERPDLTLIERCERLGRHIIFRIVLLSTDLAFTLSAIRQFFGLGKGLEDDIEQQMKHMAKGFGVELNHGVFEG